ncbi:MAG: RNA-binding S4 domain-containing protein [Bacteroidales bacterium]|nr:RNA-binding S4 domain-containing protein [Bacteroidales bacterium]MCF8333258.1 RNA-binding S4 domain-containing protein [Bacteroidales bacterium]
MEQVRIDKWLWAIRMYKTRSKSSSMCKKGKVDINDQEAKASNVVRIGDEVRVRIKTMTKTLRVTGLIEKRVSASVAAENYEDLTPQEEYDKLKKLHEVNTEHREKGKGRPTKKERREIDWLKKKL